jgi:hypothetical protein
MEAEEVVSRLRAQLHDVRESENSARRAAEDTLRSIQSELLTLRVRHTATVGGLAG